MCSSRGMTSLPQLARDTNYTRSQQEYFISHIKEIGAQEFVAALCQVAYEIGCEDVLDDIEGLT